MSLTTRRTAPTANKSRDENVVKIPPLLPIPPNLCNPDDCLCDTCRALNLSPRRFVVLPEDPEVTDGQIPNNNDIELGLVEDIRNKPNCPFCRLVLTAFGPCLPSTEDGQAVCVKMFWHTDGPVSDPNAPWTKIPQIRILKPYARKGEDQSINLEGINSFPEITLLANDAHDRAKKTSLVRFINDQIDFGMIRNWLIACKTWHGTVCDKSIMLVDNQIEDPSVEVPHFRLVDVIDNCVVLQPPDAKYVALSYVWGRLDLKTTLKLLKENAAQLAEPGALLRPEYRNGIPLTIRDAIQVVRELNFRYLWVDTLCIIQDDEGPGGSKSGAIAKMDLVYGAACLTIIAATGTDANAGLPGVRPGTRGTTQPIEEVLPGLRLGFKPRHQDYTRNYVYYTRAWPYQEQIFSKRRLIFIGGQVVYECQGASTGWREDVFFEDTPTKTSRILSRTTSNDIGIIEGRIFTYTGLSLTYESDIYHAFGGLTRYFRRSLGVNLCHGIPDAYFDWFLSWTPQAPQRRRLGTPSWSWSGWTGESSSEVWDWYSRKISKINNAILQRTWVIWYQRKAHDSEECICIYTPEHQSWSSTTTNFYGGPIKSRFPFDCTQVTPTPRKLTKAPLYLRDDYNSSPGSGFLQFWTVSTTYRLNKLTSKNMPLGPDTRNTNTPLGIFGLDAHRQLGTVFVNPEWAEAHLKTEGNGNISKEHEFEFILICESRDKRAEHGEEDEEDGWRYMLMLIEWYQGRDGGSEWAERVGVGSIEKVDLNQSLGGGPMWKEIILG